MMPERRTSTKSLSLLRRTVPLVVTTVAPAGVAVADYRLSGDVMAIYHTEVPLPLRVQGYGFHLVRGVLDEVRRPFLLKPFTMEEVGRVVSEVLATPPR